MEQTKESSITIKTISGHEIDLIKGPRPEQVNIEDIAAGLSKLCRFTGSIDTFYSVAEHSIYVAKHASPLYGVYFLLHDSGEYLTGDISTPMKKLIWGVDYKSNPDYISNIKKFDKQIIQALGLNYEKYLNLESAIKEVDDRLFDMENKILRFAGRLHSFFKEDDPLYGQPFGMQPEEAKVLFIQTFRELMR
jgi:uncharacterized protein